MNVLRFPDERLRRRAEALPSAAFGTPSLEQLAKGLADALGTLEMVDVLAVTQTDFDYAWRVLALRTPTGVTVLCNPVISKERDEAVEFEASATFLAIPVQLPAPRFLTVEYKMVDGRSRKVECDPGGSCAVWQGVASLDGRLLIDRMTPMGALAFTSKYRHKLAETLTVMQ